MKRDTVVRVTLKVDDRVTPVLRRIRRQLWWMRYGDVVMVVTYTLSVIAAFLIGRLA